MAGLAPLSAWPIAPFPVGSVARRPASCGVPDAGRPLVLRAVVSLRPAGLRSRGIGGIPAAAFFAALAGRRLLSGFYLPPSFPVVLWFAPWFGRCGA
jgi:hypothetical protein